MTEHDRETWQQNDYDPKFIETDEGRRIARAFEETGAEQIVAEHNAFSELLETAKYSLRLIAQLGHPAYGSKQLAEAIDKAEPQTPKERR